MKVFGLFGEKLSHSLSPTIHSMLYKALGLEATYSLYEIQPEMLKDAVQGIKALSISGVNVTIPYKVKVMSYLDNITDEAHRIGAINTIRNRGNMLEGFNTDYIGFGRMLRKNSIVTKKKTAVVLGTGGAAKSVVTYLEDNGVYEIYIISRNPNQIDTFDRSKYRIVDYTSLKSLKHADLLINCTPCGMYPKIDCSPIDEKDITKFNAVIDLIYNPSNTLLMKHAKDNNITTVNGLYMLVAQAAASVEIWNDLTIKEDIMDEIYQHLKNSLDK